jgi:hypothetical protein
MRCKGCFFNKEGSCNLNLPKPPNCPYFITVHPSIFLNAVERMGRSVVKEVESLGVERLDEEEDVQIQTPTPKQLRQVKELRKKLKPSIFSSNYSI